MRTGKISAGETSLRKKNIFVFGSSLTSTYWNGAATYYRGIYKYLHRLGYRITFAEPAIYSRQDHRDGSNIDYAEVRVYQSPNDIPKLINEAARAQIVIKHSGVGAEDERLEREVLTCRSPETKVIFWDVDAPATLARVEANLSDPFRGLVPQYDTVFTYGGGPTVVAHYDRLGARLCVPIYNALDPETHHPVPPSTELACDLAFVGHRLPDREARVEEFFLRAASQAPDLSFVLGGEGWGEKKLPNNVRWIGHVGSDRHNLVNCSARMVLNINRDSMAKTGFSPPTRIFEAAGAGVCLITDAWKGIESFFAPETEILIARSARDIVNHLKRLSAADASNIGSAMLRRALSEHTYEARAREVHAALQTLFSEETSSQFQPDAVGYKLSQVPV
jgi:spore maturation protein CgeB